MDTPFNPSLHALSHSLDLLKDTYNYSHWIYSLLREHLGDTICEVGAGTGNLTQFFLPAQSVLCIEPEAQNGDVLRQAEQAQAMGRAGRARVESIYSPERGLDAFAALYDRVGGRAGASAGATAIRSNRPRNGSSAAGR